MTLARIGEILTYPSERVRVAFAYDKTSLFEPSRNVCDTGLNNVGVLYRKALGGRCLVLGLVPKCHDALAGDYFEPPFFVSCSDVAAIDSHRYRAVGQPLLFPVHLRTIEQTIAGPAQDAVENIMQAEEIRAVRNRYQTG